MQKRKKRRAKPAAPPAGTHGVPTSAEATGLSVSWRNGVRFSNEDKSFDVHVGGRVQWDMADAEPSSSLTNWAQGQYHSQGPFSEPKVNGYGDQVRRARLLIDGIVYKNFEFSDQFEFAPSYTATTVVKSVNLIRKQTITTTSLTTGPAVTFADVWAGRQGHPLSRAHQDRTDVRADRTRATEVRQLPYFPGDVPPHVLP